MSWLQVKQVAHVGPLVSMLFILARTPATAAVLPGEWIDESLMNSGGDVDHVIKGHIESQLDWRSYYLDRRETWRPIPPPTSLQSPDPLSVDDTGTGAGSPACVGNAPGPGHEKDAGKKCRRDLSPT